MDLNGIVSSVRTSKHIQKQYFNPNISTVLIEVSCLFSNIHASLMKDTAVLGVILKLLYFNDLIKAAVSLFQACKKPEKSHACFT